MTPLRVSFAGLSVELATGWFDVTDDLSQPSPPTLAKIDGLGALQVSVAIHESGKHPEIDRAALRDLLDSFAAGQQLGRPANVLESTGQTCWIAADFTSQGVFIRAWYVTNGRDVALVTYTSDAANRTELEEAGAMVDTMRFAGHAPIWPSVHDED
jgi:hypothetical protein